MYKCWSCGTEHESFAPIGASSREIKADIDKVGEYVVHPKIHLPECLAPDFTRERWVCICNQLYDCEKRIRSEERERISNMVIPIECEDWCCRNGCSVPTGKHCRGDSCSCTAGFVRDMILMRIREMK
jgi:hypothetical protein